MNNYDKNAKCKICRSNYCDRIDNMLENGHTYQNIINWTKKTDPDMKLSKSNISRHNSKHRLENDPEKIKTIKRGRNRKNEHRKLNIKENEKIPKETEIIENNEDENNKKNKDETDKENTKLFLTQIIDSVKERIKNKQIKPTITEAIKAAELKIKIEKNSPFEDTLLNFVENISMKN